MNNIITLRSIILGLVFAVVALQSMSQTPPVTHSAPVAAKSNCYPDEPKTVDITGTLYQHTFPGPPNYNSVAEGDEPETFFLLRLNPPICTIGYTEKQSEKLGYWDAPMTTVKRLQLVFSNKNPQHLYNKLRPYLGHQVQCKGLLFDGLTGGQFTRVLLQIMHERDCNGVLTSAQLFHKGL